MNCRRIDRHNLHDITRRHFFEQCGVGIGKIALASLLCGGVTRAAGASTLETPTLPRAPHFAPKAKHVIYLCMEAAPSQLDLFDPKPMLKKFNGQPVPEEVVKD